MTALTLGLAASVIAVGWAGSASAGTMEFQEGVVDENGLLPESMIYTSPESFGAEVNSVEVSALSEDTATVRERRGIIILPTQNPMRVADTLAHCRFAGSSSTCTASPPETLEGVVVALGARDDHGTIADSSTLLLVSASLHGGSGNDALESRAGSDDLDGGAGDDSLRGRGGSDDLAGGAGADVLRGGAGDDVLRGAFDNGTVDTLHCGAGNDVAVVDSSDDVAADCETIQLF